MYSGIVEVDRAQPIAETATVEVPVVVGHGKPRGIAVASLVVGRLSKCAFVDEAETLCGGSRSCIQCVALPLDTSIARREGTVEKKENGLRRCCCLLELGREDDPADFDHTDIGLSSQIRQQSMHLVADQDGVRERVGSFVHRVDYLAQLCSVSERSKRHVRPVLGACLVEGVKDRDGVT